MKILELYNNLTSIISRNIKTIYYHFVVWVLYYITDYAFLILYRGAVGSTILYIFTALFGTFYFYFYIYIFYKPFINEKIVSLFIKSLVFVSLFVVIKTFFDLYLLKPPKLVELFHKNRIGYFGLEFWRICTYTFYAIAYLVFQKSILVQKKILDTERKLLLTEISFLKAQINPHFLFNTLNFVFEDVSAISPKAGDTILKLADMMRYSVQSTKMDFAPIIKEVEAIDRYIFLQRKRFRENMYVEFYKIGNLASNQIPPLIMLSLVENAFKYGVIYDPENPIEIYLEANENHIIFSCSNLIRTNYTDVETNAVGITNIRRRLEISYKNNFELENWIENKNYFVHLKIFSNARK